MKKFKGTTQRIFIFFLGILLILGNLTPIFSGIGISSAFAEEERIREKSIEEKIWKLVEDILAEGTIYDGHVPLPQGLRLLDAQHENGKITLNFSKELLIGSDFDEDVVRFIENRILTEFEVKEGISYQDISTLIEGMSTLEIRLKEKRRMDTLFPLEKERRKEELRKELRAGPLSGKKIALNPGHGSVYEYSYEGKWSFQRGEHWGILEDFVNAEIVMYLYPLLVDAGAEVFVVRDMDKNSGNGESGLPRWQEGAKHYLKAIGAPGSVYDGGTTAKADDIWSRPRWANYNDADILVGIHNNGSKGTGTETWYDNTNGIQAESKKLADAIHGRIIEKIREKYNSTWPDRKVKADELGRYGENFFAEMPSALVELAFMDTKSPDNDALHDENFKRLAAGAIYDGILNYFSAYDLTIDESSLRMIDKGSDAYDVSFKVVNQGTKNIESATACFQLAGSNSCSESINIPGSIVPGGSASATIILNGISLPVGNILGEVRIVEVKPLESNMENNIISLTRDHLESLSQSDPSGVDFSSIDLAGIQLNPTTDSIDFILKGIEGSGGPEVDTVREEIRKTFMSALVISNWKQVVSLPIGSVDIQSPFERTDLARVMLEADVAMKFDLFSPSTLNLEDLYNQWASLVKASPHWSDLQRKGFNVFPSWQARGTIVPRETLVNVEGDKIFLNEATLGLDTAMEWVTIDLSAYGLSTEVVNDLNSRLATWKDLFAERLRSVAPTVEQKFQSDSKYQKLREVYPAVALAHWYKTLPRENLPYADIIDSENLTGLEIAFDENYWASQSKQHIGDFSFSDFYGYQWSGYVYGGVELGIATPEDQGELTESQENILTDVLEDYTSIKDGNVYYLYGGNMQVPTPDLSGTITLPSSVFIKGRSLNIPISIFNSGDVDASRFRIRLEGESISESGSKNQYLVAEREVLGLSSWQEYRENITWIIPEIVGEIQLHLMIDSSEEIVESNDLNNSAEAKFQTVFNGPFASILSHEDGMLVQAYNVIFEGYGHDPEQGMLADGSLTWSSDRDGQLGVGGTVTVSVLSPGAHIITLQAIDQEGIIATDTIQISVPEPGKPIIRVTSPLEGQRISSDTDVIFTADVLDYEDGVLLGAALLWTSSLDGNLGSGEWLSVKSLSIGNHTITLKATDSDGLSTEDMVHITIEQGPPTVSLSTPADGSGFYQHDNISFSGTANDIQDGNMTSKMEWYSSRDGFIGTGSPLTKNLSIGEHTITLYVMDSDGQVTEKTIKVRVDYTPPVITSFSPHNGDEFPYFGSVTFSGSANDTQDGALSGENLIWESNQNGFLGTGSPLTVTNLAPGYHTITFTAVDKDGATDVETMTIFIDAGIPTATITLPTEGQEFFWNYSYTFTGSGIDEQEGVLSGASLVWKSNLDGTLGTGANITLSNLSVGDHLITFHAIDSQGWIGEDIRHITIAPPHSPEVSLIRPRETESFEHGDIIAFQATAWDYEDGTLGSSNTEWSSSVNGFLGNGTLVIYDSSHLSLGNHRITFKATDNLGKSREVSVVINIGNALPNAEIFSPLPPNNIFVEGEPVPFSGRGTDVEDGNLTGSSLKWYSNVSGYLGYGELLNIFNLAPQTHTVNLEAKDKEGFLAQDATKIIIVDEAAQFLNTFSDGSLEKSFNFEHSGEDVAYLKIPAEVSMKNAQFDIEAKEVNDTLNSDGLPYSLGQNYSNPIFVDINSDGYQELFLMLDDGTIRYYMHKDEEWFLISNEYGNINGGSNSKMGFVDIDNDEDYDLFIGKSNGEIIFYKNVGDKFEPNWILEDESYNSIDVEYGFADPTFVDIDNDEDYDLFIGSGQLGAIRGTIYFYRNDGNKYTPQWTFVDNNYADPWAGTSPVFVDIDNDNDLDLFRTYIDNNIRYYRNDGSINSPSWTLADENYLDKELSAAVPAFMDIDNDSDFDLFVGERNGNIHYYKNLGSASTPNWNFITKDYLGIDVGSWAIPEFVDIDNDGDLDLFIGEYDGNINFYRNDGTSEQEMWNFITDEYIDIDAVYSPFISPQFVDIDNDEDYDLFLGLYSSDGYSGSIMFYKNNGNKYNPEWAFVTDEYENIKVGYAAIPHFIDIDNDDDLDLFIGEYDGNINFYRNDGNKYNPIWTFITENYSNINIGEWSNPVFSDIDLDGDFDLFIGEMGGNINFYRNDGNKYNPIWTFITENYSNINVLGRSSPEFSDINNDGDEDLFVGDVNGGLSLLGQIGPTNPSFNINNVVDPIWSYPGEFIGTQTTANFASAVNEYLATATPDAEGNVLVPLQFHSDTAGILKVNNVNVQYTITDTEPPVIGAGGLVAVAVGTQATTNFVSPNPAYINQSITIRVSVTDNQGIASVVADVNGNQVTLIAQGNNVYQATTQAPSEPGIYPVKITATDLGGIPASITEELYVIVSGAEIAVSEADINLSATTIDEGETLSVISRVYNFGDASASFYVDLLGNGASIARSSFVTVSGNSYQDVSFNWTAQYGITTLSVQADSTSQVNEPDETNNLLSQPITVNDITPPSLANILYTNFVRVGDPITLSLNATDNAGLLTLAATVNAQTYTLNYNSTTQKYETSFTISTGGEYEVEIRATDVNGLQTSHTELLTVYWSRPDFELKPNNIFLSNIDPVEGEEIAITLTTNNVGLEAKTNIKVHFLVDGILENEQYVNLAAPASWNLNFRWAALMGSHTLEFVMDPQDQYEETVENNNQASVVVSVDTVQIPVISEVTLPEDIVEGEEFPVSVDVLENSFTGGALIGDEIVTIETDYGTTTLDFNPTSKKFEGRLLYPELGDKKMTVKAQKPKSASYLEHQKILVRSQYPDFELDEKEFFSPKIQPSHGEMVPMTLLVHNPGGKEVSNVPVRMKMDGAVTDTEVIPTLGVGEDVEANFNWEANLGDHTLVFEVDPDNTTFEFSEENNIITKSIRVVDIVPPTIESIVHDEAFIEGQSGSVKVTAKDNVSIKRVTARLGGLESELVYEETEGVYVGEIIGVNEESIVEIIVEDAGGLIQSFQKYITVYPIAADLIIERDNVSFESATITEGVPFEVVAKIENHGGTATGTFSTYLEVDGVLADFENISVVSNGSSEIRFSFTPTFGDHVMMIRLDAGGAVNESHEENNTLSIPFSVADTMPPPAPLPTASPSAWSSENRFTVSWNPVSDPQGIQEYLYQIDGGEWVSVGTATSVLFTTISEGSHTVGVVAKDRQGNLSESGITLLLYDSQIPEVPVLRELHLGGDWSTHTSPYFVWDVPIDSGSGVVSYVGALDENESSLIDLGTNIFYHTELSSGIHTFKVKAKDVTGKESEWSNELTVKIDNTTPLPPTVTSSTHPYPDSPVDNNTPTFLISAPEDESGIAGYYYLFSPNPQEFPTKTSFWVENQDSTTTLTIDRLRSALSADGDPIPDGVWYFHVVAQDRVGNIGSEVSTTKITIDRNETPLLAYDPFPSDEMSNVSINTFLAWSVGASCDQTPIVDYEIYLYPRVESIFKVATLEDVPCDQTRVSLGALSEPLREQTEYEWFIRAKDQNGNGVQSELWHFTTEKTSRQIPFPISENVDIIRPRQFPNTTKVDIPLRNSLHQ